MSSKESQHDIMWKSFEIWRNTMSNDSDMYKSFLKHMFVDLKNMDGKSAYDIWKKDPMNAGYNEDQFLRMMTFNIEKTTTGDNSEFMADIDGNKKYILYKGSRITDAQGNPIDFSGRDGNTPMLSLKRDEVSGRTYIAVGDDYLRDEDGNKAYIIPDSNKIIKDQIPEEESSPLSMGSHYSYGYTYYYNEEDKPLHHNRLNTVRGISVTRGFDQYSYIVSKGFVPEILKKYYCAGMWMMFKRPDGHILIWDKIKILNQNWGIAIRFKTFCKGKAILTNNTDNMTILTEPDTYYTIAIPIRENSDITYFELITKGMDEPEQIPFYISESRYIRFDD